MSRYSHYEHRAISLTHNKEASDTSDKKDMNTPNKIETANQNVKGTEQQKPVAYDTNGQPLYAAPVETPQQPQVVHMSRAVEPVDVAISPEVKKRHDESIDAFPTLNLSEHEYVVSAVRRHPAGIWFTIVVTAVAVAVVLIMVFNFPFIAAQMGLAAGSYGLVLLMGILLVLLFLIGGYVAIWVYMSNRFFLTNESVIQEIQSSVFSRKEQTVSLLNIEDASFSQKGPIQHLLDYGSIRLSTEGDETTYRFDYVSNPKREIAILNNAVEAFKNGRPVEITATNDT